MSPTGITCADANWCRWGVVPVRSCAVGGDACAVSSDAGSGSGSSFLVVGGAGAGGSRLATQHGRTECGALWPHGAEGVKTRFSLGGMPGLRSTSPARRRRMRKASVNARPAFRCTRPGVSCLFTGSGGLLGASLSLSSGWLSRWSRVAGVPSSCCCCSRFSFANFFFRKRKKWRSEGGRSLERRPSNARAEAEATTE